MAVNYTDFEKIWASTSPLTPYSFSDANYKRGWDFVGSTPPSRQMWDAFMKNADEKLQYLADNYLPLSGGIMTGNIANNNANDLFTITKDSSVLNQGTRIYGGNSFSTGASVYVYGKDNSSYGGVFRLFAHDGTNSKELRGNPDGTLTWNGKEVERVNANGNGSYIRYESGLQIVLGSVNGVTSAGTTVTYPMPFAYSVRVIPISTSSTFVYCSSFNTTQATFNLAGSGSIGVNFAAIGWWK